MQRGDVLRAVPGLVHPEDRLDPKALAGISVSPFNALTRCWNMIATLEVSSPAALVSECTIIGVRQWPRLLLLQPLS